MRTFGRTTALLACTAIMAMTGGVAANAADQDAASGVAATLQGSQLLVSWTHAPRTVDSQWIDVQDPSTGDSTTSPSVASDATSAVVDTTDSGFVGGHSYTVSVVSNTYAPSTGPTQARSDAVTVTMPEVAPVTPEERPKCTLKERSRLLTIGVPASDTEDVFGTHTITGRTVAVLQNSKPWKTLTVPGSGAGTASVTVPYAPRAGSGSTLYTATYTVGSAAGSSGSSDRCSAFLITPTPKDFVVKSKLKGKTLSVTWAKAKSAISPVKTYRVSWQLDSKKMRTKSVPAAAKRAFTLHFGSAKRVRVDVVAVNKLGGSTWEGVLWLKSGSSWIQGGGR